MLVLTDTITHLIQSKAWLLLPCFGMDLLEGLLSYEVFLLTFFDFLQDDIIQFFILVDGVQ